MARPLRVEFPSAHYHVINRGNAGEDIFTDARDKEKFLEYLAKTVERFSIVVHAYCLMDNHFHLQVETPRSNLSKAIQWLNVSYASYFNRKRKRSGHLFQGRFKAILVDADNYLSQLSRYIHLNPVRANIVHSPSEYPFSSYRYYLGKDEPPRWLEMRLLEAFGKNWRTAAKSYKSFVEDTDPELFDDLKKDIAGGFILGTDSFVDWVKETFLADRGADKEIPQLRSLRPRIEISAVVQAVCDEMHCSQEDILAKGRKRNLARDMAIYLARDLSQASGKELGDFFGGVSGAGITMRYKKLAAELEKNTALRARVARLKTSMVKN